MLERSPSLLAIRRPPNSAPAAMNHPLRLVLILHNHQPVGNFDGVFEQAYQDSYLPFLDVFEQHSEIPIGLHVSGSLMEWLDIHHSKYLARLRGLVANGR